MADTAERENDFSPQERQNLTERAFIVRAARASIIPDVNAEMNRALGDIQRRYDSELRGAYSQLHAHRMWLRVLVPIVVGLLIFALVKLVKKLNKRYRWFKHKSHKDKMTPAMAEEAARQQKVAAAAAIVNERIASISEPCADFARALSDSAAMIADNTLPAAAKARLESQWRACVATTRGADK